ncbi:MAG TPA: winged helix-turn-helix domain-containing protein [Candidatus Acidoferrum sp.]
MFKRSRKIKLQAQSLLILASLLDRPGEVVTREELRQKLWPSDVFVDFEVGLNAAMNRLRNVLDDSPEKPRFIETLSRRGYRFIAPLERGVQERIPSHIGSLAVLPLKNLTGDVAEEYFADGMTDALITRLAQIGALRVISRTSAMHFKGTHKKLPEIARELNVDAVVEGSVARSGSHVRINAQLVHARTDHHLWARQYERELTDILLLQADVATAIAREIQVTLTPEEKARLTLTRQVNPEAYEAFLRGRYFWNKRTGEGMKKGLEYFRNSVEKDPSFALAHAGLADSYNMLSFWGLAAPRDASPKAKTAADKALDLDGDLEEGHAARGWVQFAYDWNWSGAERQLQCAIKLNPGYATAHQWYSHLLAYQRRYEEAFSEVQRTLELDPLSLVMNSNCAFIYLLARRYEEAIERARRTIELDPNNPIPLLWLGWAYTQTKRLGEALHQLRKSVAISGRIARYLSSLGHVYALAGQTAEARKVLVELEEMAKQRYVSSYDFAAIHAGLGDKEAVFSWLEKSYNERSSWLALLGGDARFDAFRTDPRFDQLLVRLGLTS